MHIKIFNTIPISDIAILLPIRITTEIWPRIQIITGIPLQTIVIEIFLQTIVIETLLRVIIGILLLIEIIIKISPRTKIIMQTGTFGD
jgi:hypothetical protein